MTFLQQLDQRLAAEARQLIASMFVSEPCRGVLQCLCDFRNGEPASHMFARRDDVLPFLEQVKLVRREGALWAMNVRPLQLSESQDRMLTWNWKHAYIPN